MDACWKCGHKNVAHAKFCSACGVSQARRPSLKSSLPTEHEQQAIDPAEIARASMPAPALAVGARVLVQWADGQRYAGQIQQLAPGQCLVVFPDGQYHWIELRYVSAG